MAGKEQIKIYGNDKLSDRVNLFKQQADKFAEKQKSNPFSDQFKPVGLRKVDETGNSCQNSSGLSKDDPR